MKQTLIGSACLLALLCDAYEFDWAKGRARKFQAKGKGTKALVDLENCPVQFEIVQAQDVTVSFSPLIAAMNELMAGLLEDLQTNYPGSKFGLASFADKPIPYSGYGSYAAYPWNYIKDVCYRSVQPLTSNVEEGAEAVSKLTVSGGADYPENSWGGMIDAALDPKTGWTDYAVDPVTGVPVLRVMLGITDALSHVPGDAKENIDLWNELWGTMDMHDWVIEWGGKCSKSSANWARIVELTTKYRDDPTSLTAAEETEFTDLRDLCGPWEYPAPVANDGTFGAACTSTEYPSVDQLRTAFESVGSNGLIPVMVTPSSDLDVMPWIQSFNGCPTATTEAGCIKEWWELSLTGAGIQGLFYALEVADDAPTLAKIIKFALETLHILFCETQTTVAPTTTSTTEITISGEGVTETSTTSSITREHTSDSTTYSIYYDTFPTSSSETSPTTTGATTTETTSYSEVTTRTTSTPSTTSKPTTPSPCKPCGSVCCPDSIRMKIADIPALLKLLNELSK